MSYDFEPNVAKKILKDQGVYDFDAEAAKLTENQNARDMAEFDTPLSKPAKPAAPTYLATTPFEDRSQPLSPEGAANIAQERQRLGAYGTPETEASRLLGGPRQKLGV